MWKARPLHPVPREDSRRVKNEPASARHRITAAANVWAIGITMWQMMTLNEAFEVRHILERMKEHQRDAWAGRVIRSLKTQRKPEYSDDLRNMVLKCMMMTPEKRLTPKDALNTIDLKLSQHYHQNGGTGDVIPDGPRVYYKKNEINEMPRGPVNFGMDQKWWEDWFNGQELYIDASWGRLKPPYRPAHLDPWPVQPLNWTPGKRKHVPEVVVPNTAVERSTKRMRERKDAAEELEILVTNSQDRTRDYAAEALRQQPLQERQNLYQPTPFGLTPEQLQLLQTQPQGQQRPTFAQRVATAAANHMAQIGLTPRAPAAPPQLGELPSQSAFRVPLPGIPMNVTGDVPQPLKPSFLPQGPELASTTSTAWDVHMQNQADLPPRLRAGPLVNVDPATGQAMFQGTEEEYATYLRYGTLPERFR